MYRYTYKYQRLKILKKLYIYIICFQIYISIICICYNIYNMYIDMFESIYNLYITYKHYQL